MTIDPRTWMEILGPEECWRLLASASVGRLAVTSGGGPAIYPVNHVVDEHTVVFRTEAGSKLAALDGNPSVCFEVDEIDVPGRRGWSVVLHGRAHVATSPPEVQRLRELPLEYWSIGDKPNFVRITPTTVSGRRIHAGR